MTTSPAERDPQALAEAEREDWVEFIINVATYVMGAMAEQTVGARDRGDDWQQHAAGEALDLFMPHVRELLSARPAATTDTAATATREAESWWATEAWADYWIHNCCNQFPRGLQPRITECSLCGVERPPANLDPGTRSAHHDTGHHGEGYAGLPHGWMR